MPASDDAAIFRFRSRVLYRGDGRWEETAPTHCPAGHSLTTPRSVLVGWDTGLDPPHRIWVCRHCGATVHNLDGDDAVVPMRPVRLDHCHPHRPSDQDT